MPPSSNMPLAQLRLKPLFIIVATKASKAGWGANSLEGREDPHDIVE
jgi:hypothetical protein